MKKRAVNLFVIISVIFSVIQPLVYADIIYGQNNYYSLRGKCDVENGEVMLLVVKKDAQKPYSSDDVGYINTASVNKNGDYSIDFKFDKNPDDYKILIKAGSSDVTEGIFELNGTTELTVKSGAERSGNVAELKVKTVNCFSNFYTYLRAAAVYGKDGRLLEVKELGNAVIQGKSTKLESYSIQVSPEAYKVKLFTFSGLDSIKPLSEASENIIAAEAAEEIYVSPDGSDSNPGTFEAPLASLEGAKNAVRKLDKSNGNINVYFRGGRYNMKKPVIFTESDSGTDGCRITYSAYKNEKPEFVGGIYLDGKNAETANDSRIKSKNVYCIDLSCESIGEIPELKPNGQGASYDANGFELFIDDKAYFPARWPNKDAEEYNTYEKIYAVSESGDSQKSEASNPQITVSDSAAAKIASWSNTDEAFVSGYPGLPYFDFGFKFTANNSSVSLDRKCSGGVKKDGLIYFYNIPEELDSSGEYHIDRESKKLYFYSEEAPYDKDILLTTMNVAHWEKGMITVSGADNISFGGLCVNGCIGFGMALQKGRNINVYGCTFKNVSESGAYIGEFHSSFSHAYGRLDDDSDYIAKGNLVKNIKFISCSILNTGFNGLTATGGNRKTLEGADIEIYDCEFNNFGRLIGAYSPGVNMTGVGINIRNCTIRRGDSVGIMAGGNDCIIESNDIFDVARECTDCGVIYLHKGLKTGIVIKNNYIHDITDEHGTGHMPAYNPDSKVHGKIGVYNDGAGSMLTVENNVIKDVPMGFFSIGFGNKVNNNIFIDVKYPIRTRENDILISKIRRQDGTYDMPEFNENLGDTAFAELGYLEQNGIKNSAWASKYPEVFTWKEYLKERGADAIYPKNNISDNLITYVKYADYAEAISDVFEDKLVTEKSVMDKAGSEYDNILFERSVEFKDFENDDFRIDENSEILKKLPGLKNIIKN